MFEYLGQKESYDFETKARVAEEFLDRYREVRACDIYHWLWEGEFGKGPEAPELTLDELTDKIRLARTQRLSSKKIWEHLGLAFLHIKINLVPYADSGCPLKRLMMLSDRSREIKSDTLRFKQDWAFMKTQIVPGMAITPDEMAGFENSIPFHILPEVPYSREFLRFYGDGYVIVPRELFFQYFPEYE